MESTTSSVRKRSSSRQQRPQSRSPARRSSSNSTSDGRGLRRGVFESRGSTSVSYATTPATTTATATVRRRNGDDGGAGAGACVVVDPASVQHYRNRGRTSAVGSAVFHALCDVFLPEGYPDSVSSDYLRYQFWDTAQALCSSVTGTLSTRSVLRGVGVGSAEANVMSSTMSHVLRDGIAMISRLCFASKVATDLDYDAKRWRYVADVTNDTALFLEVFSSYLPGYWFLLSVCVASVFKAVTGVAGGGARASLTQHFAKRQNAADLSSKEGSQETLANLLGMALGMMTAWLVPDESFIGTLAVFATVTLMHLYCNYRAVTSLTLTYVNRQRFALLMKCFLDARSGDGNEAAAAASASSSSSSALVVLPSPDDISKQEGVLWWNRRVLDVLPIDITFGASLLQILAENDRHIEQRGAHPTAQGVGRPLFDEALRCLESKGCAVLVQPSRPWTKASVSTTSGEGRNDANNSSTKCRYAVVFRDASPPAAILLQSVFQICLDHHHRAAQQQETLVDCANLSIDRWWSMIPDSSNSTSLFLAFCKAARAAGWDLDRVQIRSEGWCVREQFGASDP